MAGVFAAGVLALGADLRERAMLGDAGSNLLGFAAGVHVVLTAPGWMLAPIAVAAIALNIVAETVTLSRVIDGVPPLRWLDRLGRSQDTSGAST